MNATGSAETPRVNPVVQAAADQVADRKRRTRKDLDAPCRGQLSLFDPKQGDRS
ncbi:hypothetical protein [Nocardia abscessus]|uniref:hypothetical protein n=1 Tax=Nocardia abscessus TaxID=120957 RepID=UPI002455B76F|nr:hypothetical protein [Nocardia abscessus]